MELPPEDREIAPKIYCHGRYDSKTCEKLRQQLSLGDTAVDIGANIGLMSLVMGGEVGISGRVVAFEPDEYNRGFLTTNLSLNGMNHVEIRSEAIGGANKAVKLRRHSKNLGAHSIVDQSVSRGNNVETIDVAMVKLDSVDVAPNLLKIDTEGAEPDVLDGGMSMITEHRPDIIIEVDPSLWNAPVNETMGRLDSLGYRFVDIRTDLNLSLNKVSDGKRRNVLAIAE
jgi:FkbM family methyltransferase